MQSPRTNLLLALLTLIVHLTSSAMPPSSEESPYPDGYYAFEKASNPYIKPPKARKPPYHRSTYRCPERTIDGRFSPKDTLCGDLNKGFIPRNPMGQRPFDDPYPFELIKNKTLEYLSRSLPYLKNEKNMPKVARFVHPPELTTVRRPDGLYYRAKRSSPSNSDRHFIPTELEKLANITVGKFENTTLTQPIATTTTTVSPLDFSRMINATTRQLCQYGSGTVCSMLNSLANARVSNALMQTLGQVLLSRPAISNKNQAGDSSSSGSSPSWMNMLSYAGEIVNALNQEQSATTPAPTVNRSPLTQVLSALTGATGNSASSSSPLVQVIDLMTSDSSPIKLLASAYSNRRKKPSPDDHEQIFHSENDIESGGGLPPTPCPSVEEYVTPTFARNYQGVWKYVVQIPQEGYLTQTVQQTKCLSGRCDFVEGGLCHESPRWISLLVAEIFYPNTYLPTTNAVPIKKIPSFHVAAAPVRRQNEPFPNQPPPVEDFHNFQQYLHRRVGQMPFEERSNPEPEPPAGEGTVEEVFAEESQMAESRDVPDSSRAQVAQGRQRPPTVTSAPPPSGGDQGQQKCDGYDRVGCYIIRMYYDWFLVNGSCKCWKPGARQTFTGRR